MKCGDDHEWIMLENGNQSVDYYLCCFVRIPSIIITPRTFKDLFRFSVTKINPV